MANPLRLSKGEVIAGEVLSDTDIEALDDAYIAGAFGRGYTRTTVADGASMTFTAANLLTGIVSATPTAARNVTLPTAATIIAAVDAINPTGLGFEFTVINLASATYVLTLATADGLTLVGSMAIAAASSGTFIARLDSTSAVTIFRK
jgi:hypothetical protein